VYDVRALKRNLKEQALLPIVRHFVSDEDSEEEIKDKDFLDEYFRLYLMYG
jgi:hypothetical protein